MMNPSGMTTIGLQTPLLLVIICTSARSESRVDITFQNDFTVDNRSTPEGIPSILGHSADEVNSTNEQTVSLREDLDGPDYGERTALEQSDFTSKHSEFRKNFHGNFSESEKTMLYGAFYEQVSGSLMENLREDLFDPNFVVSQTTFGEDLNGHDIESEQTTLGLGGQEFVNEHNTYREKLHLETTESEKTFRQQFSTTEQTHHKTSTFTNGLDSYTLDCGSEQFEDKKMMLCRYVHCHTELRLDDGECRVRPANLNTATCFSVFIKLTPIEGAESLSDVLVREPEGFKESLQENFESQLGLANQTQIFRDFHKLNDSGDIEYSLIYIVFSFANSAEKMTVLNSLIKMSFFEFEPDLMEITLKFLMDLGVYDIIFSGTWEQPEVTASVSVTNYIEGSVDKFTRDFSFVHGEYRLCLQNETTPMNKLHRCPFIILAVNEFPMEINNAFLLFCADYDQSKLLKALSRWEYELTDDEISICLDDYLKIYRALPKRKSVTSRSEKFYQCVGLYTVGIFIVNYSKFA